MLSSAKAELERVQSRGTELLQESLDAKSRYNRKLKQLHARKDALTSLEDTLRSQTSDVAAAQRALEEDRRRVASSEASLSDRARDLDDRARQLNDREAVSGRVAWTGLRHVLCAFAV